MFKFSNLYLYIVLTLLVTLEASAQSFDKNERSGLRASLRVNASEKYFRTVNHVVDPGGKVQPNLFAQIYPGSVLLPPLDDGSLFGRDYDKELQLTDAQIKKIKQLVAEHRVIVDAIHNRRVSKSIRQSQLKETVSHTEESIWNLFTAEQKTKFRTVTNRLLIARYGLPRMLLDPDISFKLNLSEEERSELETVIEESRKNLVEQTRKLQAEANQKIIAALSAKNKAKLKRSIGSLHSLSNSIDVLIFQFSKNAISGNDDLDNEKISWGGNHPFRKKQK